MFWRVLVIEMNFLFFFILYRPEDAAKALEASQDKMFFGKKIKVMAHEGVGKDFFFFIKSH